MKVLQNHKLIIVGLSIVLVILVVLAYIYTQSNNSIDVTESESNQNPTPPSGSDSPAVILPSATPVPLPTQLQAELTHPIRYEDITIDYRPNSGTFVVFYVGSPVSAEQSFNLFREQLGIEANIKVEYLSLDSTTPDPQRYVE